MTKDNTSHLCLNTETNHFKIRINFNFYLEHNNILKDGFAYNDFLNVIIAPYGYGIIFSIHKDDMHPSFYTYTYHQFLSIIKEHIDKDTFLFIQKTLSGKKECSCSGTLLRTQIIQLSYNENKHIALRLNENETLKFFPLEDNTAEKILSHALLAEYENHEPTEHEKIHLLKFYQHHPYYQKSLNAIKDTIVAAQNQYNKHIKIKTAQDRLKTFFKKDPTLP